MKYAAIMPNDIVDGEGVCVSYWAQGCPHHCEGCHNPETWSFNGGKEKDIEELKQLILELISKNGVKRNFSVLGGEPLCPENVDSVLEICKSVREKYPNIKIFLWTGYTFENLESNQKELVYNYVDVLIDGRYVQSQRNIILKLRGSTNQRVIDVKESAKENKVVLYCE
jgi:anaerobic ribonucleoside-triphosphate reductase activating protein